MGIKLSHSAINKYKACPASYKLHYLDRIRENKLGSALIFGSALDETLNRLLATKMKNPPKKIAGELYKDYIQENLYALQGIFDLKFAFHNINNEVEDIRTSHIVDYFGSDFDEYVLKEDDLVTLKTFMKNAGYEETDPIKLYKEIAVIKKEEKLNSSDLSFYNYASFLSLRRKGHLMIETYIKEIMPKIKNVVSVQKYISLPNESGDELIGYLDFEAEMEGHDGIITMDNKTSSKLYKSEDINIKGQLSIYDEFTQNGKGGYIVLIKKMKYHKTATCQRCDSVTTRAVKNCPVMFEVRLGGKPVGEERCKGDLTIHREPYVQFQILITDIDNVQKDLHFDEACDILEKIEKQEFEQDRDSCFQYGRKCAYYNYCRSNPDNPDTTGLVKA